MSEVARSTDDPAQAFQVLQSHRAIAKERSDVGAPALSETTPPAGIVDKADHPGNGAFEIGFRPYLILPEWVGAWCNRDQAKVDQARDLGVHESHVAGVRRGDHRPTKQHRFGQKAPESFGPMQ